MVDADKTLFSDMDEKIQQDHCSVLFLVSPEKNPDAETDGQFEIILEKINQLPDPIQNKIFSYEIGSTILKIGGEFSLQLLQIADITRAIRNYYFGELKIEDMPFYLAKEIPIDVTRAQKITQLILTDIINDSSIEEANQSKLENITLADAIKIYPEISEQSITTDRIKILSFPEPVRPSIKNWLADYTSTLGQDAHNSIIRGNYLFHSDNAKKLNSSDRQKLSYILKSFDEKSLLTINKTTKQIIFNLQVSPNSTDHAVEPSREPQRANLEKIEESDLSLNRYPLSANKISFSSPQKLSYERTNKEQTQPQKFIPAVTRPQISANAPVKKTFGKNVVNLKELI